MIPRLLRTAIGFGGGFLAIWMVYNIEPRWLGIVAGIATFVVAILAMNVVYALLVEHRHRGSGDSGPPPPPTS